MLHNRGGKKYRSSKRIGSNVTERRLEVKSSGQNYGKVVKILGNRRLSVLTNDGIEVLCIIPGKFKSKSQYWINKDDILLITERGYQDDKCDVIYIYRANEVKKLYKMGELSDKLMNDTDNIGNNDTVEFRNDLDMDADEEKDNKKLDNNIIEKDNKNKKRDYDINRIDMDEIDIDDL